MFPILLKLTALQLYQQHDQDLYQQHAQTTCVEKHILQSAHGRIIKERDTRAKTPRTK